MGTWKQGAGCLLLTGSALACNGTVVQESAEEVNKPDIHGIGIFLPHLMENIESGPFPDLIHVLARHYSRGKITFSIEPVRRAVLDSEARSADFRFPVMKVRETADGGTPYQYSRELLGKVTFVLYSNKAKPLSKPDILKMANLAKYSVEASPVNWGFPTKSIVNLELSLKRLNFGRIDAVIWAQEEADFILRKDGLKSIHREHFDDYPDVFFLPCTRRGDFVNHALGEAIRAARASGELQKAYAKVHKPYQNWQP
ncbi:amino acid ABC transporter substrate-binding protein [Chromobacterium haemolyticum]|uniref:amino acid ABC transporter substrate-binding protein n=1 Tax=Chromobacterium haemolyticum TaxID=394935 RepID=UPI001130D421|nr:amino acid ABC transporter substrate-binding protein [Chromobacterium haemolyticum]